MGGIGLVNGAYLNEKSPWWLSWEARLKHWPTICDASFVMEFEVSWKPFQSARSSLPGIWPAGRRRPD